MSALPLRGAGACRWAGLGFGGRDRERGWVQNEDEKLEAELWVKAGSQDSEEKVEALIQLSYMSYNRGDHAESLALCETARDCYEALGASASAATLAHIYNGIGYSLENLKRHADAALAIDKAAEIYTELGSPELLTALRYEGDSWYNAKEFEKAFLTYKRAFDVPNPDIAEGNLAMMYGNAAGALQRLKKWPEALEYFLKARELHKKAREPQCVVHCDEEIALCYYWLGNGMEAQHYAQKALDYAVTAEDDFHLMWANARMGLAKKALGEFDEALEFLATAKSMMVHRDTPPWRAIVKLEKQVASIYVIKGQLSQAREIERRIETLKEIVFDADEEI